MPKARRKNAHRASRFEDMALPQELLDVLEGQGKTVAFEIQEAILPDALAGRDVLARAETGSGKTLAYALSMCARFRHRSVHRNRPLGLVLVPTRELATQVVDVLHPLARAVGIHAQLVSGGMNIQKQADALRRGAEIIVATPGRLVDLGESGDLFLDRVECTVIDEADLMSDLGFGPVVADILAATEMGSQKMLFSATLDDSAQDLVDRFLVDPVTHETVPAIAAVRSMSHTIVAIQPHDKGAITAQLAARRGKSLLFTRTQLGAERVAQELQAVGVHAAALHGSKQQGIRSNILAGYREGAFNVLVATDVAARGLDIENVTLVLHVDPPSDGKEYVHRSGRTARAGEEGRVVTLALPHQIEDMTAVARNAGIDPEWIEASGPHDSALRALGARNPSGDPIEDPALTKYKGAPRKLNLKGASGADQRRAAERRENEARREVYSEDGARERRGGGSGQKRGHQQSRGRRSGGQQGRGQQGRGQQDRGQQDRGQHGRGRQGHGRGRGGSR